MVFWATDVLVGATSVSTESLCEKCKMERPGKIGLPAAGALECSL